jgi:putative redox protein
MTTERTVAAKWTGGLRAEIDAGGFPLVADEPVDSGGTGSGPQPTELLLASIASCFTLAVAYTARKRDVPLEGLDVAVTGVYDGPRFRALRISVHACTPTGDALEKLVEAAKRVCYVTNTIRRPPEIEYVVR